MKEKKIVVIGPYSAIGGVSIHCKRLVALFEDSYNFVFIDESPRDNKTNADVFNIRSKNAFKYLNIISKSDIVHIHTGIWWLCCFHILIAFMLQKKTIVSIHSLSNVTTKTAIAVTRVFLKLSSKIIFVSEEISEVLKTTTKNYIIPAFIPPNIEHEPQLPSEIEQLLQKFSSKKIIVGNAFKLVLHNNEDLYGLDLLLAAAMYFKKEQKPFHILFVVASKNESLNLSKTYQQTIKDKNLAAFITIIPYPLSFIRLMQASDLVVRPTNTDGDALTIREALFLKKPIIASNVTKRPTGTILFDNRNATRLANTIIATLEDEQEIFTTFKKPNKQSFKDLYLPVFEN